MTSVIATICIYCSRIIQVFISYAYNGLWRTNLHDLLSTSDDFLQYHLYELRDGHRCKVSVTRDFKHDKNVSILWLSITYTAKFVSTQQQLYRYAN